MFFFIKILPCVVLFFNALWCLLIEKAVDFEKNFWRMDYYVYLCTAIFGNGGCFSYLDDQVAQSVEHIPFKDGVLGSNPSLVTSLA